jgi:cardiolipin synthase
VRFGWSTRLGGVLDPAADKLLITGLFVTLAFAHHIPVWLAAAVILRDVVIVAGAMAYNFLIKPVPGEPTRVSKLNTALQMLFVLFVISRAGFGWPEKISITVLGAAILVTVVISGVDYVLSWSRRARAGE